MPSLVALDGSPVRHGNVDLLLEQVCEGFREAGGEAEHLYLNDLWIKPCQSCGPEPTTGFCRYHDDMDAIYPRLEKAHAIAVGSPIYFDTVSAQLKLVMDRCNCITMLVRAPGGGEVFRPQWERTRRGVFVTASGRQRIDLAERSVRGFLKWIGAKWEETLAFVHSDNEVGRVTAEAEIMARAREVGRRLALSPPLTKTAATGR
jgi:NAD(P)H-dependent FMN reductase